MNIYGQVLLIAKNRNAESFVKRFNPFPSDLAPGDSLARSTPSSDDLGSETARGYCLAVRSTLTDDGVPPSEASGLKLHSRLTLIEGSLERVAQKGD